MLYKTRNSVIKFFDDYSLMVFEAKYETTHKKWLKIITPKQMLQRLRVALTQIKVGNRSENLSNEICQLIYIFLQAKEITKKVSNNIISSIKL